MATTRKKRTAPKPAQFSELVLNAAQNKTLDNILSGICQQAHKHEVQHWLDAKGTDEEKLRRILFAAREALHLIRKPEDH